MIEKLFTFLKDVLDALGRNWNHVFLSFLFILLTMAFLYYYYAYPVVRMGPEQPISFSHRVHAGVKQVQCLFCHSNAGRSPHPGIPAVEKCLFCHKHIIANHPEIQKEHAYFNADTSIPWKKVNYLPEYVFFNHERHVKKDIDCKECHGRVETMDRLKGADFQMGFCIECHRAKNATVDCWLACHN